MDTDTLAEIRDHDTATRALNIARDNLDAAAGAYLVSGTVLRKLILDVRPQGILTVGEMAEAVGRDRNYIDTVWSSHGDTTKGKQTRVAVGIGTDAVAARKAYDSLHAAADMERKLAGGVRVARAERNRLVVMVYSSKLLGPSAISAAVGIDRNHVLRTARKAGIAPVHRPDTKNQYTNPASN